MTMMMLVLLGVAFVSGALAILVAEAVGVLFFIRRINQRVAQEKEQQQLGHKAKDSSSPTYDDPCLSNKQGIVWILESENVRKDWQTDSVLGEQKRKKEIFEIVPVQKHATVKDNSMFISESDGFRTEVKLRGCIVAAVSATSLSSRKWAKRYPIKVESKESEIYKGSKILYIYLDTSWEKESWCKALRLASCDDKEKLKWFANLNFEFQHYVASLNAEYPSFMKPSVGFCVDPIDKSIKFDGSSSRVRQFLKKLAKKASKSGLENKASWTSTSVNEEKKNNDKSRCFRDYGLANMATAVKLPDDMMVPSSLSISPDLGSRTSVTSDVDSDEKIFGDEGTLCWNLLLSRLFFDAKSNGELKNSIQARIQKILSNMRSPSYIGEVTCTAVDPGNLPPYIHAMRVLPSHMNELWGFDIDIEYSGGAILNIETRLEVQELDLQKREDESFESSAVDQVTSDLLESFEHFGGNLKISEEKADKLDKREGEAGIDGIRSQKTATRSSSQMSRWKSMLHSVAKQVSQVPLSLGIRISSLRGTIRLYIKPPPSDCIWFGFTSMPDLDFNLESFIGEHKITNGRVALLLISRFKAFIRESLVLPNCENIRIPWMLGEKDDWVPRNFGPFIWIKQDPAGSSTTKQGEEKLIVEANRGAANNYPEGGQRKSSEEGWVTHPKTELSEQHTSSAAPVDESTSNDRRLHELTTPLLKVDEQGEVSHRISEGKPECHSASQSLILTGQQNYDMEDDDARPKRIGTRARMLGLGKKVGEKLEEKRRHIEERGRHIVERMKGPQ